jgi:hypothetical protein
MKIGITQFGRFVIFLLISQDYRSAEKVKMVFLKKCSQAGFRQARAAQRWAGPFQAMGACDLANNALTDGARPSEAQTPEAVRGFLGRSIKS